jgi:signal transduction histidine kinase
MVEDDGVGFEPDQVQGEERFGLIGLKERAEALGGTLTVESAPGAGTTVVVEVPHAGSHPHL